MMSQSLSISPSTVILYSIHPPDYSTHLVTLSPPHLVKLFEMKLWNQTADGSRFSPQMRSKILNHRRQYE